MRIFKNYGESKFENILIKKPLENYINIHTEYSKFRHWAIKISLKLILPLQSKEN